MNHGGKRAGAGRKKGYAAIEAEKTREYITQRVSEALEPIIDALIEHAKQGDLKAIHELFDRAWGKPHQGVDIAPTQGAFVIQIDQTIADKNGLKATRLHAQEDAVGGFTTPPLMVTLPQ